MNMGFLYQTDKAYVSREQHNVKPPFIVYFINLKNPSVKERCNLANDLVNSFTTSSHLLPDLTLTIPCSI